MMLHPALMDEYLRRARRSLLVLRLRVLAGVLLWLALLVFLSWLTVPR